MTGALAAAPAPALTILVPELDWLLQDAARPVLITRLLARAQTCLLEPAWAHGQLVCGSTARIPPAPLSRLHDQPDDAGGAWIRADPVALAVDITTVWIAGPAYFPEEKEKRAKLEDALGSLFEAAGMEYLPAGPEHGYLRLTVTPECRFFPPWRLAGARLEDVLPEGPAAGDWRRLLNETQMLLHEHPALKEIEPVRRPAGLWFWGAGEIGFPPPAPQVTEIVAGDDPVLAGMERWLGLSPAGPDQVIARDGHRLIQWRPDPARARRDNLEILSTTVLEPAWNAVRRFKLKCVRLANLERCYCLEPVAAWQFWRGRRGAG